VTKVESLLAFVLGAEGKLTRVELGPIEPIVASVEQWRRALGTAPSSRGIGSGQAATEADELQAGEALRKLVWDPLRVALGISQHVILALDDVLHLVPFDALPDGEGVVGDRITFEIRTSLQELLWKNRPSEAPPHAFVGLGGAAFGRTATVLADSTNVPETRSDPKGAHASLLRGGVNEEGFQELPGTAREVEALREIHTEAFGKKKGVFILRGAEASRDALEALAPSARYVHIATHGWCAQVSAGPIAEGTILDAKLNFGQAMSTDELTVGSSPMTLCGLALAGANLPADTIGRVHGLVTAEEIASWDLSNCELVVLSACDTNVGVRRAGQGVASLQKALHMAGARSAITSLWKVPDELTAELMMDFYRRLWIDHEPIGQALWKAKTELRSRGIPTRDWAAWELTGQSK
jgi:CHAT domain-containing protein